MSRYAELSINAGQWSKRHYDHVRLCSRFAQEIARRYSDYLGAPAGAVRFIGLRTPGLEFDDDTRPLQEPPKIVCGHAGVNYFGIVTSFPGTGTFGAEDRFHLGLRREPAAWEVSWDEKTFSIPLNDLSKLDGLFEGVVKASMAVYVSDVWATSKSIGFLPIESASEE